MVFIVRMAKFFLMESKSGSCQTKNISHINKIKEAYNDLDKYITGESEKGLGNPWINAYNHANQGDVKAKKVLKIKFGKLEKTLKMVFTQKLKILILFHVQLYI